MRKHTKLDALEALNEAAETSITAAMALAPLAQASLPDLITAARSAAHLAWECEGGEFTDSSLVSLLNALEPLLEEA